MSSSKIIPRQRIAGLAKILRSQRKKIVFTNGCFDLIHLGHLRYLQQAKSRGDSLIVGLNSDRSVSRIKGPGRPIIPQRERALILAGFSCIDYVTIFNEETPEKLIALVQPHVLIKGADWQKNKIIGAETVKKCGGAVLRLPLVKGRSTSQIIDTILQNYGSKK